MGEVKEKTDIICNVCGAGPFKSASGLAGHKQIAHNEALKVVKKDEIGKRLETIETQLASTIDPKKAIETEADVRKALELLLPAVEKFGVIVGPHGDYIDKHWFGNAKRKWIVCKESEAKVSGSHI